jgi:predicted NAD/FAD-dependent oxidoreductase
MNHETIILGAGISGLILAHELRRAGRDVLILEKSRGVGGRIATKRLQEFSFDQGAPFFSAKSPFLIDQASEWLKGGVVERWSFPHAERWRGTPTANALPRHLSQGLNIRRECKVTAVFKTDSQADLQADSRWRLETEQGEEFFCNQLFMTAPVPQNRDLLKAGNVVLDRETEEKLSTVAYAPCLAGLFLLEGASQVPAIGAVEHQGLLTWISDRTAGSGSGRPYSTLMVHAEGEWSRQHYAGAEEEILSVLEKEAAPWIGGCRIQAKALHRWKFAKVKTRYPEDYYLHESGSLGMAGDSFGEPRIEGAVLSGLALARAVLEKK